MATLQSETYICEFNQDLNTYFIYEKTAEKRRVVAAIQDNKAEAEKLLAIIQTADPSKRLHNTRHIVYSY